MYCFLRNLMSIPIYFLYAQSRFALLTNFLAFYRILCQILPPFVVVGLFTFTIQPPSVIRMLIPGAFGLVVAL